MPPLAFTVLAHACMATEHPPYSEPWEPLRVPTVAITHGLAVLDPDVDEAADEEALPDDEQALAPSPSSAVVASSIANDRDRYICRRLNVRLLWRTCAGLNKCAICACDVHYMI